MYCLATRIDKEAEMFGPSPGLLCFPMSPVHNWCIEKGGGEKRREREQTF